MPEFQNQNREVFFSKRPEATQEDQKLLGQFLDWVKKASEEDKIDVNLSNTLREMDPDFWLMTNYFLQNKGLDWQDFVVLTLKKNRSEDLINRIKQASNEPDYKQMGFLAQDLIGLY